MPRLLVRLGVMRFVKDEKRDLLHLDEAMCERVQEQLARHDQAATLREIWSE